MQGRRGRLDTIERKTVTNYERTQVYLCHNLSYTAIVGESIEVLSITVGKT